MACQPVGERVDYLSLARLLIDRGANIDGVVREREHTLNFSLFFFYYYYYSFIHISCFILLLVYTYTYTYIVTSHQDGCVALRAAVLHKHADVYEYILEKGNPDINAILPVK
jgi:hypothetical protein